MRLSIGKGYKMGKELLNVESEVILMESLVNVYKAAKQICTGDIERQTQFKQKIYEVVLEEFTHCTESLDNIIHGVEEYEEKRVAS